MSIYLEEREENDMLDYTYTIEEAKKEIKESVSVYFTKGADGHYVIPQERQNPFYLVGAPGIGKTQMVREIAEEIGCGFFATSLTHHTRNSILGLPVIRGEEVKYTEYTMPEILAVIEEKYQAGETEGLLLLDEFASMPESLVAPMLAFLQNKTIGNHKLPEGWVLILASNPPEYNRTARTFDAAIMDRVRTMQIVYDQKDFLEYGEKRELHPAILEFVQTNAAMAYLCSQNKREQEIVTARGWVDLSDCLYGYEQLQYPVSVRLIRQFIKSDSIASQFFHYYSLRGSCLTTKDLKKVLQGEDITNYKKRMKDVNFDEKWRTISLLKSCLSEECEKSAVKIIEYDMLTRMMSRMEDMERRGNIFNQYHEMLGAYLGYANMFRGNNSLLDEDNDQEILSLLKEKKSSLLENLWGELSELVTDSQPFGLSFCSNSDMMEIVKHKVEAYRRELEQSLIPYDSEISNAIGFVREIGKKDRALLNGFVRMIGKDDNILRVLSFQPNEAYARVLLEAA